MTPHPFLISLACLALSSCAVAAVGAVGAAGVAAVQDSTVGEALDDATASNAIKAELLNRSGEKFAGVDVEVSGGLVLLSGRVNDPEDRVYAEGVAWRQSQVHDVANEIRIAAPGGFVSNVADEIITARVRTALITSRTVKSYNFNIETYDGVVYLMGIARTADELRHAAEKASVIGGVKQVVSYVEVRQPRAAALAPASPPEPAAPATTSSEAIGEAPSYQDELDGSYNP